MQHLDRRSRRNALPWLYLVLGVLAFPALLAVACGGSPSHGNQANQSSDTQTLQYVQCMQQHGVNAKTGSNGHGVGVPVAGQPGTPSQQQLQAAQQACQQYLPNGGMSPHRPSTQQMDRMAKLVQCLNQHGVPAQQSQGGPIQMPQGTDRTRVQQAMQACRQYTPAGGGGG